jgi:endonuclease YncB( thermonuclease family)
MKFFNGLLDGDTIEVLRDGRAERIRLHGIDSPESGQAFGAKATQFVLDMTAFLTRYKRDFISLLGESLEQS